MKDKLKASEIISIVAIYFKIPERCMYVKSRIGEYVEARQISMYFIKLLTKLSLSQIGNYFNRDHATVLHAIKTVNIRLETELPYKRHIKELRLRISGNEKNYKKMSFAIVLKFNLYSFNRIHKFETKEIIKYEEIQPEVKEVIPIPKSAFISPYAHIASCTNQGYHGYTPNR